MSILYVVGFWHLLNYTQAFPKYGNFITLRLTLIVLGTFVFISGYLIGLKEVKINSSTLAQFYKRRIIRIYPLYLIAIIMFTFSEITDMTTSVKAGLAVSMIMAPAPPTLWFVSMLMLFYFISPLLIHAFRRITAGVLVLSGLVITAVLLAYSYFTGMLDDRIVLYFPAYALGVFVASKDSGFPHRRYAVYLCLATFGILLSFVKTSYPKLNLLMNIPMVMTCSYLLFRFAKEITISSRLLYRHVFFLSYSSYCMYLFHRPIYTGLSKLYFPETGFYQVLYLAGFCLPLILVFSFMTQKTYDIIVRKLTNRTSGDKHKPAADLSTSTF